MLWKHVLCSLPCAFLAFASSIPRHEAQQPLLLEQQPASSKSDTINVVLAFTESGSTMEQQGEIPLHERVLPGVDLPSHLSVIKIVTAVTGQGRSVSLERLDKIMCRMMPETRRKDRRGPPEEVRGDGMRIQGGDDQVDDMYGQGKAQRPPNRRIPAQTLPTEQKIKADLLARYQRGEQDEDAGACICSPTALGRTSLERHAISTPPGSTHLLLPTPPHCASTPDRTRCRDSFGPLLHLRTFSASSHSALMGWFGSSSKDDSGVKKTEGGAFESPSRSNRKQCYAARDAFFECLDKNNVLDSINTKSGRDKAASFCGQFDHEFEKNCAHSWVEYFKKQRVVNYQREQTIKKIEMQGGEIQAPQLPLPGQNK
ncbi:cytochrome c oxidase subunit vib protein [Stemphylium lycopersici]|nr:cytochrome c oxidase subunit vib protein [Stemphylium lycopersici]